MIPVIRYELLGKKWFTEEHLLDNLALATSFPGAIAVNLSLITGYRLRGIQGAFFALAGTVLPSFLIILAISYSLVQSFEYPAVKLFFKGAAAGVAALIASAAVDMGRKILVSPGHLAISVTGILVAKIWGVNPLWIIFGGAFAGYLILEAGNEHADHS